MLDGHLVRDPHDLHAKVEAQLDQAAEEVSRRCANQVDYQSIRQAVAAAYRRLSDKAKFQSFLPILAARAAHRDLCQR
ncbi:three-helix bundle dimerization domain-containing protein [Kibdelosporangium persicum]